MKYIDLLCLSLVLTLSACGSSSDSTSGSGESGSSGSSTTSDTTAPTISSVTTHNGSATDATLSATAGDRVSGASNTAFFTITFSEAMDPTTVIASNITLTCNSTAVTVGTPATSDNITWTVPVSSDLTGYVSCTLTLGTGLKDAAGNALATAGTYAFNTACSTTDEFDINTLGFADASDTEGNCWFYGVTGSPLPSNSSTSFSVMTAGSALQFESPASSVSTTQLHYLYKTFGSSSFTATIAITSMSLGGGIDCYLTAESGNGSQNASVSVTAGANCQVTVNDSAGPASACSAESTSPNNPLYFQLAWDGSFVTGKVGASLSNLTTLTSPGASTTSLGSSYKIGFKCGANTSGKLANISSFTVSSATATGPGTQY